VSGGAADHEFNVALQFMHYNFCRVHHTLRVAARDGRWLHDHVLELEALMGLIG